MSTHTTFESWIQERKNVKHDLRMVMYNMPIKKLYEAKNIQKSYEFVYGYINILSYTDFIRDVVFEITTQERFNTINIGETNRKNIE